MTCNDYNLAENIKDPNPERTFKEIMLLQRIDATSMQVRKTLNGDFKGAAWRASYCPAEQQGLYQENSARDRVEAARKAAEKNLRLNPWRPRDGI